MQAKEHWEHVYETKATDAVSWYQPHASRSLQWIRDTSLPRSASIIDVGGGASTLVDDLLSEGYSHLTVLDLSAAALAASRSRIGHRAEQVHWIEGDIAKIILPGHAYDLWHDRAVFHFLTSLGDRQAYVTAVLHALKPGGHVLMATFAEDGPTQCSGLPVRRYSAEELHAEFSESFSLLRHENEVHRTPGGKVQHFVYCHFRRM